MAFYDINDREYADLRSARKIETRHRARMEKYYHFKGIHQSDLPSHPTQRSHYRPADRNGKYLTCMAFPPDLSAASVHRFTKREAYEEAQLWPRPPTHHHSRVPKDSLKWERQNAAKKLSKREIRDEEWRPNLFEDRWADECIQYLDAFDRYCLFGEEAEYFEYCLPEQMSKKPVDDEVAADNVAEVESAPSEDVFEPTNVVQEEADEGYVTDEDDGKWSDYYHDEYYYGDEYFSLPTARWHRNHTGWPFLAMWNTCSESFCACHLDWDWGPELPTEYPLGAWMRESEGDGKYDWWKDTPDDYDCENSIDNHEGTVYGFEEPDWDVVSLTSEAWTEVEEGDQSDFENWG
ncbi:hypothetical protein BCR34DRAFT_570018 [Clohesyomyces aquaticus]|uniref:Uncharacterized protein n=1 Tax=Clohesyomyces aquaticus TaxID=1231657 RepID=A0A1Y1ZDL5_9PLEO|nr:hypothetical protein BCR34DRAFT_570018 [Clohesyomyces aquaticus]